VFILGKYRDRLQIIADILSITSNGAKKTTIMHQANLSYKLLCRYLNEIMDAGLAGFCENRYILTSKGKEFLLRYDEYSKHRERLRYHLDNVKNKKILIEHMCSNTNTLNSHPNRSVKKEQAIDVM